MSSSPPFFFSGSTTFQAGSDSAQRKNDKNDQEMKEDGSSSSAPTGEAKEQQQQQQPKGKNNKKGRRGLIDSGDASGSVGISLGALSINEYKKFGRSPEEEADELVEQGEQALGFADEAQATKLFKRALKLCPTHTHAMDLLAAIYMESEDDTKVAEAARLLRKSTQVDPMGGHEKWFSLAQLQDGADALQCYQKGIDNLQKEKVEMFDYEKGTVTERELDLQISCAYCSMAELYVTDLCDEECAEKECERLIKEAISICSVNPEAFYNYSNLRCIQGRKEDAAVYIKQAVALLHPEEASDRKGRKGKPRKEEFHPEAAFSLRVSIAKMLLELELWEEAIVEFEGLLQEDDRYVELWYLTGVAYSNATTKDEQLLAVQYLMRSELMLQKSPEPDLEAKVKALVDKLKKRFGDEGIEFNDAGEALGLETPIDEDEDNMDSENSSEEEDGEEDEEEGGMDIHGNGVQRME